jgi:hypothetical protein
MTEEPNQLDELNELNEILEKYQPVRPLTVKDIRSLSKLMNMCSLSDIKTKTICGKYRTYICSKNSIEFVPAKSSKSKI